MPGPVLRQSRSVPTSSRCKSLPCKDLRARGAPKWLILKGLRLSLRLPRLLLFLWQCFRQLFLLKVWKVKDLRRCCSNLLVLFVLLSCSSIESARTDNKQNIYVETSYDDEISFRYFGSFGFHIVLFIYFPRLSRHQ